MGVLEAITYAMGEQLNVLSGVRLTRVAEPASIGDAEIVLERTLGMDPSGTVVIDNITYQYGALRDGAISDLTVTTPQGVLQGVQTDHALNAVVTDATRDYSQLDLVRRALFVNTAEGPDLSTLGRMLGVLRQPDIVSDDQYRTLIKAIAYNPRTTMYGLTQALNALVGPGNFDIIEDFENQPCTVLIALNDTGFINALSWGKSYLSDDTEADATDSGFTVAREGLSVGAVHPAPISFWLAFGQTLPSRATATQTGSTEPTPFAYVGSDEAQIKTVHLGVDRFGQALLGAGYYHHDAALVAQSRATGDAMWAIPDVTALSAIDARRCGLRLVTEQGMIGAGCVAQGGQVGIGLCDVNPGSEGALLSGVGATVPQNEAFEMAVTVQPSGSVTLELNGRIVQQGTLQPNTTGLAWGLDVGALGGQGGKAVLLAAGLSSKPIRDMAALSATVTAADAQSVTFPAGLTPEDVGASVTLAGALYTVTEVNGQTATVSGLAPLLTGTSYPAVLTRPIFTTDGTTTQIQARSSLAVPNAAYVAAVHDVLSAQVFEDGLGPVNHRIKDGPPPTYAIWPFYLADNVHFIESYLGDMLVAGVQLKIVRAEDYL